MPENLSYNPDDDIKKPDESVDEAPEVSDARRGWLIPAESLLDKLKEKDEKKDDEEDDDDSDGTIKPAKGFFRRLFTGDTDKNDGNDGAGNKKERDLGSIVFSAGAEVPEPNAEAVPPLPDASVVEHASPVVEAPAEHVEPEAVADEPAAAAETAEPTVVESTPVESSTESAAESADEAIPEVAPEAPRVVEADPVEPAEAEDVVTEAPAERVVASEPDPSERAAEVPPVVERGVGPETVLLGGLTAYEHHRVTKLKRREQKLEREVKRMQRTNEKIEKRQEIFNRRAETKLAEHEEKIRRHTERVEQVTPRAEQIVPRVERVEQRAERQAEVKKTPTPEQAIEQKRVAQEARETRSEGYSETQKQAIIETVLKVPEEIVAAAEEHKEIAYELSHEHKDLDKQQAAAWAALQASADATTQNNAQALAQAARATATQDAASAAADQLLAQARGTKAPSDRYKKAAFSGFLTAIVIFAIILVILVLNSK